MKEKKQSVNWSIAVTHYLTSGFVMPFLVTTVLQEILAAITNISPILSTSGPNQRLFMMIIIPIFQLIGIWLGVMYSAKYLTETYIINDSSKIINLSTIYFLVLWGLVRVGRMYQLGITIEVFVDFILFIILVLTFYLLSKRYIHNTEAEAMQPVNNMISSQ